MRRLLIWFLVWAIPTMAQPIVNNHTWEIYLARGVTSNGADRLTFIDLLTGETITTEVVGERYTPLGEDVIYYDYVNKRVMAIGTDGLPRPHPFIQLPVDTQAVDWVVSPDGRTVAWTVTTGPNDSLSTVTTVASAEGANRREVFVDGGRNGVHAIPVAFNVDKTALYMDAQPFGVGRFLAYAQYAGLFQVDLDTRTVETLPNEPACFCGAGFFDQLFLRLLLNSNLTAFDLRVYNLTRKDDVTIPAVNLVGYTQAGDVMVSPDGTLAVYALSKVEKFGTPQQTLETVFVLVDLQAMTQRPLTEALTTYVQPMSWTEDNTAILFTSSQLNGTWKINLADGQLKQVAEATLIGRISAGD